ncbi:MAG: CAP domain-containing protein [Planctomycetes bacterium]|nr:CAP domain-containing protein [Planctomycetota bacterium]MCC7396175.1 CAP domain-containing protein [Planctomycetota bacterium]
MPRRFFLICLTLAATLVAQDAQTPLPATTLLGRLKANDLTLAEAGPLAESLPFRPTTVRLQAADALRAQYLTRAERFTKAVDTTQKSMAKALAAPKDKNGQASDGRVAELRAASLAITRRDDLSKGMIHDEIDPLVAELRGLLLPDLEQVLARAPAVADAVQALRASHQELQPWFDLYCASIADFDLNADAQRHLKKKPPPAAPMTGARLEASLGDWLFQSLPLAARDQHVLADNEAQRSSTDAEDFAGTYELNRRRYLLGLPLLRIDAKLGAAARDHSDDMLRLGFFSHTSPVAGKRTPGDRAARFGTSGGAENIAAGHDSGASAIDGWWYSPGHHKNLLGNHGRTGLGHSGNLWTQMFGG